PTPTPYATPAQRAKLDSNARTAFPRISWPLANVSSMAPRISSRSASYSRSYDHTAMSVTAPPDDENGSTERRRSQRQERALGREHRPKEPFDERRARVHAAAA